ncbi:helix-turn-helix domain-containing protein [Butyrivibrio sp. FCS014]|uniref:helix-turn-helix domain-containing protein n=1 Tax=Butyrivibrio sp. FCS014 TaxID=1408304 RepID=UPI0004664671|nr:helix-turn-helix transcriptional regulator [Butyrivibrio sp. FCS014]
MSMGTNIKALREERKLTQDKVAEALGVTFQAVSSWERDEYKPDTDKLIKLAELFDVSVSAIAEERQKAFHTKETIYNWEHMKTYVKTTARNFKLEDTLRAVDYAEEAHRGQTRKRSTVPYIYHPLNLACHALSMGIIEDEIIAACLLHDVVEDCGKKLEELPVSDETKELVRLLTRKDTPEEKRKETLDAYFHDIAQNPKATLVKCLDRCNNLTTMSWGLSRDRIYRTIKETEEYFPPLIKVLKDTTAYGNASWLLKYQMESMLDIYKRLM